MAKLQVLIAMTLDGSIPAEDDPLLQWMRDDKDGFSYGRDKCTRRLYPGYPLVDFMCEKDMSDPSILYQAEIHDEEIRRLYLHRQNPLPMYQYRWK